MQKNVIIAIVVILAVGVGAFLFFGKQQPGTMQQNAVTSIKDALSKSVSLTCTYTDEQGRESTTVIKNGAIRSDYTGQNPEESGSVIVKDDMMYVWDAKKQGFKMSIPKVTITPGANESSQQGITQEENFMANLEKYKNSCKPAVISDSQFTPPADVIFTDYSEMMQQFQNGYPSVNPSQMEQMMQQYGK